MGVVMLYFMERLHDFPDPVGVAIAGLIASGRVFVAGYLVREDKAYAPFRPAHTPARNGPALSTPATRMQITAIASGFQSKTERQ